VRPARRRRTWLLYRLWTDAPPDGTRTERETLEARFTCGDAAALRLARELSARWEGHRLESEEED